MPPPTDEVLSRIAAGIVLSRDVFASLYDPLAVRHGTDELKMVQPRVPMSQVPFFSALAAAREGGWIDELCLQLLSAGAIPEVDKKTPAASSMQIDLQGIVQPLLGYLRPELLQTGVMTATRRVGCIIIDHGTEKVTGTGFLVGPQALMTAWHVVSLLVDAKGAVLPNSQSEIRIEFDRFGGSHETVTVHVAEQWLIESSRYHPTEMPSVTVTDFNNVAAEGFDVFLDYAVIRLQTAVGRERGFYKLDPQRKPRVNAAGAQVTLFQHPSGVGMRVAMGVGVALWPPVLESRLRHNANAQHGASGGLLVDAEFQPIALHQCGFSDEGGSAVINGAIPTACIATKGEKVADYLTVIGFDPIWKIAATAEPVLGREDFQRAVLLCLSGKKRILAVSGDPKTGKSFSIKLLRSLLGDAEHSVIEFRAAELEIEPERLAAQILKRVAASSLASALPSASNADTAIEAWIKDTLFPEFAYRLKIATGQKMTWLVIDDLDVNPLPNGAIRHFLERLYQEIELIPLLRIVLIGFSGVVPGASALLVSRDLCRMVTHEEISTYIGLYSSALNITLSPAEVQRLTVTVEKGAALLGGPRFSALATYILEVLHPAMSIS